MQVTTRSGRKVRARDEVDVITGISGGSFTALAYGLYGEKLFDEYEKRFLKRDVQGELIARAFNPFNWGDLVSSGWGRSELAANYYDEILFNGATYADLKPDGPRIFVGATDLSEGTRIVFNRETFDVFCSDLTKFRLARAAAASSAVPVVLSSITVDNYGAPAITVIPRWAKLFMDNPNPPRPAARVRNIFVFIVNSLADPPNDWDMHENPPGTFDVLIKAAGTPIDRYSYDTVETLKDMQARWQLLREVKAAVGPIAAKDPKLGFIERAPEINIYVIDVSFQVLRNADERNYLNQLPTSFVLSDEAVDRLRVAARTAIVESPVIQQLMKQGVVQMVGAPAH